MSSCWIQSNATRKGLITEPYNSDSGTECLSFSAPSKRVSFDMASDSLRETQTLANFFVNRTHTNLSQSLSESPHPLPASDSIQESAPSPQHGVKKNSVHIPDMFSSIMAIDPCVNPHYHKVKLEADLWLKRYAKSSLG